MPQRRHAKKPESGVDRPDAKGNPRPEGPDDAGSARDEPEDKRETARQTTPAGKGRSNSRYDFGPVWFPNPETATSSGCSNGLDAPGD